MGVVAKRGLEGNRESEIQEQGNGGGVLGKR